MERQYVRRSSLISLWLSPHSPLSQILHLDLYNFNVPRPANNLQHDLQANCDSIGREDICSVSVQTRLSCFHTRLSRPVLLLGHSCYDTLLGVTVFTRTMLSAWDFLNPIIHSHCHPIIFYPAVLCLHMCSIHVCSGILHLWTCVYYMYMYFQRVFCG